MRIEGRTFLVSGGASGLGGATARMLVDAGGQVVVLDVNAEAGRKAEAALGERARFAEADVSREEDVARAGDKRNLCAGQALSPSRGRWNSPGRCRCTRTSCICGDR